MSFVATAATVAAGASAVLTVGSKLMSGYRAGSRDNEDLLEEQRQGARDLFSEQMKMAGRENQLTLDKAMQGRDFQMDKIAFGGRKSLTDLQSQSEGLVSKSGFAGDQSVDQRIAQSEGNIWESYNMDKDNIMANYDMTKQGAALNMEQKAGQFQEEKQSSLSAINAQPDTFLEGLFA